MALVIEYERLPDGLEARHEAGDKIVTLRAQAIRQTRTGIHAKLTIGVGSTAIGWDNFNVERDGQRRTLAGHAIKEAEGIGLSLMNGKGYTRSHLEHELMLFCRGLWPEWIGGQAGGWVQGDPEHTEVSWRLKPYIPETGGVIWFGPKESGKTWLCLLCAASMEHGSYQMWDVEPTRVLVINLERSEEVMQRRLGRVNEVLGLDEGCKLLMLNRRGKRLADVYDAAGNMKKQEGVDHVLLDSLSRGGFGDLNENAAANDAIDGLNALCPSWSAFAHTARGDESHVYGSVHFENGADVLVGVTTELKGLTRGIGLKAHGNDVPPNPLDIWAFEFEPWGLSGVRKAQRFEFPEIEDEGVARSPEQQILDQFIHGRQNNASLVHDLNWSTSTIAKYLTRLLRDGKIDEVHDDRQGRYYEAAGSFFGGEEGAKKL